MIQKKVKLRSTEFDQLYEIESYQYMYIKCPADTFLINVWGGFSFHPIAFVARIESVWTALSCGTVCHAQQYIFCSYNFFVCGWDSNASMYKLYTCIDHSKESNWAVLTVNHARYGSIILKLMKRFFQHNLRIYFFYSQQVQYHVVS